MLLRVEHEPVGVDLAVEVHGELGDARHRVGDVDEDARSVGGGDATGDAEVTVEPRVVEDAAVHLDAELLPAEDAAVGPRFHAQARRVGVTADDAQRQAGIGRSVGQAPGDQGRVADDVARPGQFGPVVGLVDPNEPGQPRDRRLDGVPRRRGRIEEVDQIADGGTGGGNAAHDDACWNKPIGRPVPRRWLVSLIVTIERSPLDAPATRLIEV